MAIPNTGGLSSTVINSEFGRSTQAQMSINAARNGSYGAINAASGKRPTANGQSGYAWSHWRGYNHGATYPTVYITEQENYADTNVYFYINDNYGNNILGGYWYFFGGTWNVASDRGITIRENDGIYVQWAFLGGWGDGNTYTSKYVTTNQRGTIFSAGGPTSVTQEFTFYPQSGEVINVYAIN